MITILPAVERSSTGARLGQALGDALKGGAQLYGEHQKKKRYGETLRGVEDIYADPNMPQEQKFIKSFSAIREFPDIQKQFSSGLSQVSETPLQKMQHFKLEQEINREKGEESFYNKLMGGDQNQQPPETPSNMPTEMEEEPTEAVTPKKARPAKFDLNDSSTWINKQINNFRGYEGENKNFKSLAKRAQNEFEQRQESKKVATKYQESIAPLEGASNILNQMENLGKGGLLSIGTKARGIESPKTRRAAGEYERLVKSLISYSTNIPIRNRMEFEILAHDLYDPSISDDSREGILAAMRRIIQNSIQNYAAPEGGVEEGRPKARKSAQKERPPLTSFLR